MDLDDDTLELLGYGSQRLEFWASKRHQQVKEAWLRYSRSAKGREAIERRNKKHNESGYHAVYYAKNSEAIKQRVSAYYKANKERINAKRREQYAARKKKREFQRTVPPEAGP